MLVLESFKSIWSFAPRLASLLTFRVTGVRVTLDCYSLDVSADGEVGDEVLGSAGVLDLSDVDGVVVSSV